MVIYVVINVWFIYVYLINFPHANGKFGAPPILRESVPAQSSRQQMDHRREALWLRASAVCA